MQATNTVKKTILITGVSSYIGKNLSDSLLKRGYNIIGTARKKQIDQTCLIYYSLDLNNIEEVDTIFKQHRIDVVVHCAALVHDEGKTASQRDWLKINTEASIKLAEIAKRYRVKQMIFMSTIGIYGGSLKPFEKLKKITAQSVPNPQNMYEISKLKAEQGIQALENEHFSVLIIRPPMVYGNGCPGNYNALRSITLKLGCAPYYNNSRSMVQIGALVDCIVNAIENENSGCICPQDKRLVNTSDLMMEILKEHGCKQKRSVSFGLFIRLAYPFLPPLRKAFGSLVIDEELSCI